MIDVDNSTNFVLAIVARQGANMIAPFLREDGVTRVTNVRKIVNLVTRGTPIPYGELVSTSRTLSTGATAAVAAGNHLLIGILGVRNASSGEVTNLAWQAPLGDVFLQNGGGNGRTIGTGFGQDESSGAKSNVASWQDTAGESDAIAALLVFEVS
jgi:hypothetical protein